MRFKRILATAITLGALIPVSLPVARAAGSPLAGIVSNQDTDDKKTKEQDDKASTRPTRVVTPANNSGTLEPDDRNVPREGVPEEVLANRREQVSEEEQALVPYYNNFLSNYRLGPEDVISVDVFDEARYSKANITIPPDGRISYYFVPDGIFVVGKTTKTIAEEITKHLDEFLREPKVTVSLEKANSARYGVMGDVAQPGIRTMSRRLSVYEALLEAGGVLATGDKKKVIVLRQRADSTLQQIPVDIAAIEKGKAPNVEFLRPGDQVFVPGNRMKKVKSVLDLLPVLSFARVFAGGPVLAVVSGRWSVVSPGTSMSAVMLRKRKGIAFLALLLSTGHVSPVAAQSSRTHRSLTNVSGPLTTDHRPLTTASWSRQESRTMAWLRAVSFIDESRGWAVGGAGTLISTVDGGKNWTQIARPTEDTLLDVFFLSAEKGWLVCEPNIYRSEKEDLRSYLLTTSDGGASWKRVQATSKDINVRLVRVVFADDVHGWAFGELGALFATTDGGATWTRQPAPTKHLLLGASFLDGEQGWLVGAGGTVLHTRDSGATWRHAQVGAESPASPEPRDSKSAASSGATKPGVSTVSTSNIALASAATRPRRVASSMSPRRSPHAAEAPLPRLHAVSFVNAQRGWAVGAAGQIFDTRNGGVTWQSQVSNVAADLFDVKFFDEHEGWAAGAEGTLLHTTDGGVHWRSDFSGTRHPLERLAFSGRKRGWAVGFGGTILAYSSSGAPAHPTLK